MNEKIAVIGGGQMESQIAALAAMAGYKTNIYDENKENLEYVSKKKDELNKKNIELKNKLKDTAQIINNKSFAFNKESKENGELYGSIKPKEISTAIFEKMKVEIKPSQIVLKNDLNKIGNFKVDVNFHTEVSAQILIKIDKIQSK